ncbi:MAG: M23 family metallopeptidase [Bacteroides sp.]|nr:M23 family metallopeptidase [Bacteroides sp.]
MIRIWNLKNKIRSLMLMALMGVLPGVQAQEKPGNPFVSPFDFPLLLSGNFGELRANHFHGGVDFKTQGVVGKPIRCIADGYISRVTVTPGGYGQAVYITHDNGYTSVHGHLHKFMTEVEQVVEAYQYEHETFAVDLTFGPDRFPLKQGEVFALAGNEGYSFGPHLHMELRKTDTGEYIDPLQFYTDIIKDKTAPRATHIMLYPQAGKGVVAGSSKKKALPLAALQTPVTAWGKIAVGIKAYDYMDGTSNNYGVRSVILLVDSVEVFRSTVDGFLPDENRMINAWTDYEEYATRGSWFMRSQILPGNTWRMLQADEEGGVVTINEERLYEFCYVLEDLYGNRRTYRFKVQGKEQPIEPLYKGKHYLSWNQGNVIQKPGMELVIPKGMLYEDVDLNCRVIADSLNISFDYQLHDRPVPLHAGCSLMIGVRNYPIPDMTKYYVVRKYKGRKASAGGYFEEGFMHANIRELGTYSVALDTVAPRIVPLNRPQWKGGNIRFKIRDAETGIKDYKVYIDGAFVLFKFSSKNAVLSCMHPSRIKRGMKHRMEVVITDYCGNVAREEYQF